MKHSRVDTQSKNHECIKIVSYGLGKMTLGVTDLAEKCEYPRSSNIRLNFTTYSYEWKTFEGLKHLINRDM